MDQRRRRDLIVCGLELRRLFVESAQFSVSDH
jgi:hypothetical protein